MTRNIFIINPNAGKYDHTSELKEKINKYRHKYSIEIIVTEYKGHAPKIVDEKAKMYSNDKVYIYSCGGDGTLNEIINIAHKHPNVFVGVIPIGSGNDFIRSFETVSKECFLDIENMLRGNVVPIDLLFVGKMSSVNVITFGFDCAVAKNMVRFKRLPFISGTMAYKISLIYCLISKINHKFTIKVDGKEVVDESNNYLLTLAANGRFYGGGFKAAPRANMADGKIDFIRVNTISRVKFLSMVGKYKTGEYINDPKMSFVKYENCETLEFFSDEPLEVNFDGEIISMKNPKIEIKKHAIKMIFPFSTVKCDKKSEKPAFKNKQMAPAIIAKEKNT